MGFKVPYSNFHELNLDWVLEKMAELEQKVDAFIGSAIPSDAEPLMDQDVGSPGESVNYSRGDHVHPTDTSRASAAALHDLEQLEAYDIGVLGDRIQEVDDKIAFTTAAPEANGVASAGSSDFLSRSDHVHPTDTTRASQTQVDSLQAAVDAFSGSASPSDATPLMDGVGAAGTGGNYSRSDHVHPSDTAKVNKAGDTISGDLYIEGSLIPEKELAWVETNAVGWLRIATVAAGSDGSVATIEIVRRGDSTPAEYHRITFNRGLGARRFTFEKSLSVDFCIDKIRYQNPGAIDIHMSQNYASKIGVRVQVTAPTEANMKNTQIPATISYVDNAPSGETTLAEYTFDANTLQTLTITAIGGNWYFNKNNGIVSMSAAFAIPGTEGVAAGYTAITTLPVGWRPLAGGLRIASVDNPTHHSLVIDTSGLVRIYSAQAYTTDELIGFQAAWVANEK